MDLVDCGGGIPINEGTDNGCAPGDFSCNPFQNVDNPCANNPWAGACGSATQAFQSLLAGNGVGVDPCVYLNNAGNGVESVDRSSSPQECGSTGGTWMPDSQLTTGYGVDAWGNVFALNNWGSTFGALQYQQYQGLRLLNVMGQTLVGYFGCVGTGAARGAGTGAGVGLLRGGPAGILPGAGWGSLGGAINAALYSCGN
jgi:hypothetical protein